MNQNNELYVVMLNVEFLPNSRTSVLASCYFLDKEIAELSLSHIRQTYPKAKLFAYVDVGEGGNDDYYQDLLTQTAKHDEYLRKRFLINY